MWVRRTWNVLKRFCRIWTKSYIGYLGLLTQMKAVFCIAVLVFGMFAQSGAFAESHLQVLPTDKGTVKVGILTIPEKLSPGGLAKLKIDFLTPKSGAPQEHIDYTVSVTRDGKATFGPIPLTHTSTGTVTIPVEFKEKGEYKIIVDVQGVLFQPIPSEKATFSVMVGQLAPSAPAAKPAQAKTDAKAPAKTMEKPPAKPDAKKTDKAAKADAKPNSKVPAKKPEPKSAKPKP